MTCPGMLSADEIGALETAPDAKFQELWLQMMIEHHTGADRDGRG